jgi:CHAT domain-containing protein/tetratricopeptide (TPR) repeat protein
VIVGPGKNLCHCQVWLAIGRASALAGHAAILSRELALGISHAIVPGSLDTMLRRLRARYPSGMLPVYLSKLNQGRAMLYSRNQFVQRITLIAASLLATWTLVSIGDEPQPDSQKPPYERLLKGDDAKLAEELSNKIEEAEKADNYDEAIELSERLLELRTNVQGADHWETVDQTWQCDKLRKIAHLSSLDRNAWRQTFAGAVQATQLEAKGTAHVAEPLRREHLKLTIRVLGEQHPAAAASYNYLAQNLWAQGNNVDAQRFFQRALDIRTTLLGDAHPLTSACYNNLAESLRRQGKFTEAQPLYQKALDINLKAVGEKHQYTAATYNGLALNLKSQAKYAEAQLFYQKALDITRELVGEQHRDTALGYNNLALNLDEQGKHAEAQQLYQKAIEIKLNVLGEKHPSTAISYSSLAQNLNAQGQYGGAQPLFQKALEVFRELLGEFHPVTATGYNNLGFNLNSQGRFGDAQPLYRKALDIRLRILGEKHPETANSYNNLGSNLTEQERYADAEPLLRKALDIRLELLGRNHPDTAVSFGNLAGSINDQGRYAEAQPYYQNALDIHLELFGEKHTDTATGYNNLAANLADQRRNGEAQLFYQKALEIRLEILGKNHPSVADSYINLARNMSSQAKPAEREFLYQQALELYLLMLGDKHPRTTMAYKGVANDLCAQGKIAEASNVLERAALAYEAVRLGVATRGLNRAVFGAAQSPYPLLAATKAQSGMPSGAWMAAEADLSRGLSDELAFRRAAALSSDEQRARANAFLRLEQMQPQIIRLQSKLAPSEADLDELAALHSERTKLEGILVDLAAALSRREVADQSRIQRAIPTDAALVLWIDVSNADSGVNEHWGCVIRPTGEPRWERLPGTGDGGQWTADDSALPSQFREALAPTESARADADDLAHELYDQRLAPLAKHLAAVKTLYVASVNQMAGIPIEVLTSDFTVSYVPSGTFLARLADREPAADKGLLALGDPIYKRRDQESEPEPSTDLPPGGLLITQVQPGAAAAKAGLQPRDVLVRYGDTDLNSVEELTASIQKLSSETDSPKEIPIAVWREGEEQLFTRHVLPGRLGVGLAKEPAREAIANRRKTDATLLALRGGNWDDLPGTRAEVSQIAKLFGNQTKTLVDSDASEQSLDDLRKNGDLSQYRYLHLATHGQANDVRSFESVLILAQDKLPKDPLPRAGEPFINGQLSANEVLEFWDLNAELVTLSACETALGRKGGGDGLLGFAQAFLKAGSRAVCLSLWKVDDTATALLMTRFYQNLLGKRPGLDKPMPKAQALADAKKWLRELSADEAKGLAAAMMQDVNRQDLGKGEPLNLVVPSVDPTAPDDKADKPFSHPRYWSAFILIGDPN